MELMEITVGKKYEKLKGVGDATYFDMTGSGALLVVALESPSEAECTEYREMKQFQIGYKAIGVQMGDTVIGDVAMIVFKVGDMPWADAPYSPHLGQGGTGYDIQNGMGLALTVVLADSKTGEIKSIRVLGLQHDFSVKFVDTLKRLQKQPFSIKLYDKTITDIYNTMDTSSIVAICDNFCSLPLD